MMHRSVKSCMSHQCKTGNRSRSFGTLNRQRNKFQHIFCCMRRLRWRILSLRCMYLPHNCWRHNLYQDYIRHRCIGRYRVCSISTRPSLYKFPCSTFLSNIPSHYRILCLRTSSQSQMLCKSNRSLRISHPCMSLTSIVHWSHKRPQGSVHSDWIW